MITYIFLVDYLLLAWMWQSKPLSCQQKAHKWNHFWAHVMCIKDSSKTFIKCRHMNHYLRKDKELDWWDPMTKAVDVIAALKAMLLKHPMLNHSQPHGPYMIHTDTSAYQLEAVLLQQNKTAIRMGGLRSVTVFERSIGRNKTTRQQNVNLLPWYELSYHSAQTLRTGQLKFWKTIMPLTGCSPVAMRMKSLWNGD